MHRMEVLASLKSKQDLCIASEAAGIQAGLLYRGGFYFLLIHCEMYFLNIYPIQSHQVSNAGEGNKAQAYWVTY